MGTEDQNADSQTASVKVDPPKDVVCDVPTEKVTQARQIIICCDGTNNTLTGGTRDTNVLKLISHLVPGDKDQVLYYDPGVGSPDQLPSMGIVNYLNRKRERISGLAKGRGIYENIAEAYLFLVEKYREGDEIFIFGFSRGAFTARCVAGMVNLFGLIRSDSKPLILTLIRVYFSTPSKTLTGAEKPWARYQAEKAQEERDNDAIKLDELRKRAVQEMTAEEVNELIKAERRLSTREEVAEQVRKQFTTPHGANAIIHFIGVWDTVASVGLPLISRRSITSDGRTKGKNFRHIRHALSMDEHRFTFEPRLYWEANYKCYIAEKDKNGEDVIKDGESTDKYKNRTLIQRWFRGVHSDVGGGYNEAESGLAISPYLWMLGEAKGCGLRTDSQKKIPFATDLPFIAHDEGAGMPYWNVVGLTVRHNKITNKEAEAADQNSGKTIKSLLKRVIKAKPPTRVPIAEGDLVSAPGPIHLLPYFKGKKWELIIIPLLAVLMLLFMGRMAYWAMFGGNPESYWRGLYHGMACLDFWQRTFFSVGCSIDATNGQIGMARPDYAYGALSFDFLYVVLYAWVVGLLAGWAFREVTLNRKPTRKVSPLLWLGWAPCMLVFAHLAEILLSALKIWLIQTKLHGIPDFAPLLFSPGVLAEWNVLAAKALPAFSFAEIAEAFLLVANLTKWTGFAGTALLIVWGLLQRLRRPAPAPKSRGRETKPDTQSANTGLEPAPAAHPGILPGTSQPAIGTFRTKRF